MGKLGTIKGMQSLQSETLDRPGFISDASYINKKGTPSGESAMFNRMPPGMDISNQECCDINDMPMRKLLDLSYPGDGAFKNRDIPE